MNDSGPIAAARDWPAVAARYAADGVVLLPGLVHGEWLERLQGAVAAYRKRDPGGGATENFSRSPGRVVIRWMGREVAAVQDFVAQSGVADAIKRITAARTLKFWYDLTLVYTVGSPYGGSPWHHDIPAFPFRGEQMPSLWIALSPVDADRSPLKFVRGSHTSGALYPPSAEASAALPPGYVAPPDWDALIARGEVDELWWPMQPGDALLMHQRVVHSTPNNRSNDGERVSIITRWLGDDAVWHRDAFSMAIPGVDMNAVPLGERPAGPAFVAV
ncbi:MAG: phytanoyl-CoA dioxygenase family protein [Rhodospirillaceae bacterium]|nr:phytanoyl-CoA dioxygenase family protein [Rhodospirillaceae bacterium]